MLELRRAAGDCEKLRARLKVKSDEHRYFCQSTELSKSTEAFPPGGWPESANCVHGNSKWRHRNLAGFANVRPLLVAKNTTKAGL